MATVDYAHVWTLSSVSGPDPNWGTLQVDSNTDRDNPVNPGVLTTSNTGADPADDLVDGGSIGANAGPFGIVASYTANIAGLGDVVFTLLYSQSTSSWLLATTQSLTGPQIIDAFNNGLTFKGTLTLDNPDTVCFLKGTHILTRTGYCPVESLAEGDEIKTLNHGWQPVRWVGHREIQPRPHGGFAITDLPIRIARDAFGAGLGLPARDLWVSPDHAVFFRDHLIPAKHLVNGATIARDSSIENIVYYHVLLNRHSVIFSEALPTESYVPSENQDFFENVEDIPAELANDISCQIGPMMNDCYPRVTSGPVIESARAFLAKSISAEKAAGQIAA